MDHAIVKRFRQEIGGRLAGQRRLDARSGLPPMSGEDGRYPRRRAPHGEPRHPGAAHPLRAFMIAGAFLAVTAGAAVASVVP
ncbi:MAG: hypothetical protein ACM3ML_30250 [Micromonosporaceae bacterium]